MVKGRNLHPGSHHRVPGIILMISYTSPYFSWSSQGSGFEYFFWSLRKLRKGALLTNFGLDFGPCMPLSKTHIPSLCTVMQTSGYHPIPTSVWPLRKQQKLVLKTNPGVWLNTYVLSSEEYLQKSVNLHLPKHILLLSSQVKIFWLLFFSSVNYTNHKALWNY